MEPVPIHPLRLEAVRAYYRRQLDRFEALAPQTKKDLKTEQVHALRVSCRRLRAVLWLLRKSPIEGHGVFRKTNRSLRKLGRDLGELRTLEVAQEDAKTLAEVSHRKIKNLKDRKKKASKTVRAALAKKRVSQLLKHLHQTEKSLNQMHTSDLEIAVGVLSEKLAHLSEAVPASPQSRHRLRLQLKRIRYVLVALGSPIESLSEVQDSLGKEHDLAILREMVGADPALAIQRSQALSTTQTILKPTLRLVKKAINEVRLAPRSQDVENPLPN